MPDTQIDVNSITPKVDKESVKVNVNTPVHNEDNSSISERGCFDSIQMLTLQEMLNIDQWLSTLNQIYDKLNFPLLCRVYVTAQYFLEAEKHWYEQTKHEINADWFIFCDKLKQHVATRLKSYVEASFSSLSSPATVVKRPTMDLSLEMARELIRTPIYFHGSKDDIFDWLAKIEHRFEMACWADETKLRYISIHLADDAYKWWLQASKTITTWSDFISRIKQAFSSSKMKELAFEQLRGYKQSINQSVTQYYDKVSELCMRVDPHMPDSLQLQYLLAGVRNSLKMHIALYDPQSSASFLSYARKVEDTLSFIHHVNENDSDTGQGQLMMHSQSPINVHSSPSMDSRRQPVHFPHRPNTFSHRSRPVSSIICYQCGTPGHYARDCTRRHFE